MDTDFVTAFTNAPDIDSSTWDYANRFAGPVGEWLLSRQIEATRELIKQRWPSESGLSVLDVGGGHGQNVELINELGHDLTILGSTKGCAEVIQSPLESGRVKFDIGSLLTLPYKDNSFDIVICYRILPHMECWRELIGELTRVARHLVLVDYPSKCSVNVAADLLFVFKHGIEKNARPYHCFFDKEIDAVFNRACFSRVNQRREFFFPMAFYRLVGNLSFAKSASWVFRKSGLTGFLGSPVISVYQPD